MTPRTACLVSSLVFVLGLPIAYWSLGTPAFRVYLDNSNILNLIVTGFASSIFVLLLFPIISSILQDAKEAIRPKSWAILGIFGGFGGLLYLMLTATIFKKEDIFSAEL